MFAIDDREQKRDERHLKEAADDPREPRTLRALGIQARASEQQRREQVGEGEDPFGFVQRRGDLHVVAHGGLQEQRREDRERDPGEIEREQRDDPGSTPRSVGAQQE